ncbi:bifunctional RecB family nuclease/DEAD/DEAH box helicase [uncultured Schumannella sp.]|uniref:TM0106 family RecB-like putative nuclease n=1 Tax=uncultured Schumannella sp. TaxID=1195956 RepID=UPI0025E61F8E|nr:bifunctional RecB family nuclease/DEAD/DEAH box helicase [uncultured Schumannella sp.]
MFILRDADGSALVTSPSDLKLLSDCEYAFARTLDLKLGRLDKVPVDDDPMLKRAGRLGDRHEADVLDGYRAEHADAVDGRPGVVEIARPTPLTAESLRAAAASTVEALRSGAAVVFQATFFDETDPTAPTIGYADFLVRQPDGRYRVQDTKVARSVKVSALLQLAAYHDHLVRLGIPVDDTVELLLGDGSTSEHAICDIAPVYRLQRERLREVVTERLAATGPTEWGDPELTIDGHCVHCADQLEAHDDLLQVAGIRLAQRQKLLDAGITTMGALAATPTRPEGCTVPERSYQALHEQARLQTEGPDAAGLPRVTLHTPGAIAELPAPDAGDLYFDFEGDPLWRAERDGRVLWGLDYLFGMTDNDDTFTAFWAHDLPAEADALRAFLDLVAARRAAHPGMHIYHYAAYEKTHLLSIAARHGVGEHEVDELLRDGVLVDLYPLVRKTLRAGVPSYSIKKLEPLYMGSDLRREDGVTNAADSVEEYQRSRELALAGDESTAQKMLDDIADYNTYDCVSTRRLRDWLIARAGEHGVFPGVPSDASSLAEGGERAPFEESPLALGLEARAAEAEAAGDPASGRGYRLAAAAIDYHRREQKSFWWEHFARLTDPVDEWSEQRGVFLVERVEVERDWFVEGRQRNLRRHLRLHGEWAPGSGVPRVGGDAFALYEAPGPFVKNGRAAGSRLDVGVKVLDGGDDGDELSVLIEEVCPTGGSEWNEVPLALAPGPPPKAGSIEVAIGEFGTALLAGAGEWPRSAASDVLLAATPHTDGPLAVAEGADDVVRATIDSLLRLDRSYLAVQGPPGTGKTYLAAHVIRALVAEHGWRVGVVAQSHRVVENVLDGIVEAGLDADLVAKTPSGDNGPGFYSESPFSELPYNGHAAFHARHAASGYVLGGTAWDFTNLRRVARGQLDLLVIDEAGQFSLANTIGVAQAASRLLLVGDPQQLPQVSQGIHPAPVDGSALEHVGGGHDVLPDALGYFLAETRRMHPDLTAVVSHLSYEDALRSHPSVLGRELSGVAPGLHAVPVEHAGESTESLAEAERVREIVASVLGREWTSGQNSRAAARKLSANDVIVVTPYNAQLECIREVLDAAGFDRVRVGTVDKFQGQEAVIAIVSLAASSAEDVPRGLSFLLSRNRLNVAISRAQWAAYLVYSPGLLRSLPTTPEGVAELSRFAELVAARPR